MPINWWLLPWLAHVALIANLYLGREPCVTWLSSRSGSCGGSSHELPQHSSLKKMCQTATAQRRPYCLSKIKQCLVSPTLPPPLACAQIYACTHTHTPPPTPAPTPPPPPPPPAQTLIVPSPESLIKNKLQLLVSKQHSMEVGVWSLLRQSSKERERATANLINISVSLGMRQEK